eukprot:TRINITY_DN928_c0_g1_i1.p1 TRINITY_DN928_c0_g1~~TRINITY_DN928_c0_g1_i1.p1  ORF type:complete len:299 (+),score=42.25 TRINITY_DN928_c0_g1_i1:709-1605(+)
MDPNPRTNLNDLDLPVTQLDEAFYGDNTNLEEPTEEVQLDFAENKYGDTTSSGNLPAPYVYQQPQIINESSSSSMNQFDQAPAKPAKFYQIEYYQFLFDIDTKQVGQRIARSLIPYPATFLELVKSNPDIYGPFWIATTLVFILAVAGNTSSYLKSAFRGQDEGGLNWEYDAQRLSVATGVIYGYLFFYSLGTLGVSSILVQDPHPIHRDHCSVWILFFRLYSRLDSLHHSVCHHTMALHRARWCHFNEFPLGQLFPSHQGLSFEERIDSHSDHGSIACGIRSYLPTLLLCTVFKRIN